jgi:hypothetical protein
MAVMAAAAANTPAVAGAITVLENKPASMVRPSFAVTVPAGRSLLEASAGRRRPD